MTARMLRLFPGPVEEVPLDGAYLAHRLHSLGSPASPFVYASFVSSLDGRIAVRDPATGESRLPAGLVSGNDFRLFLELQAQADCLITHGGYLRDLAAGRLDDVLQVGTQEATRGLARWRADNGLSPQPAVVIASASLEFPIPDSLARHGQRVLIATGAAAPAERVARWRAAGYEVLTVGAGESVEGAPLVRELGRRGLCSLYLLAGPRMLDTMLRDGRLSRLYLTTAHRLLGGESVHTMLAGPELGAAGRLRLCALHYDASAPDGTGQCFAHFEPRPVG
ncbi:dihydrofolate reductase family protein [Azospirillum sp. TSO35-2]|uniref:RibD family protein n=1 Tax=Azospirillum sp. TSO35-2 TaxID=716796 RepID=UPI000D614AE1|nr:dihydrofolate reductase family protein [Azospirillum sp. TSO35-2]PWC37860.1 riboflavin biosynthesis protein RibD [Azospirillum sp. TSO35-2]